MMESLSKGKVKKGNLIVKTWERCKSFGRGSSSSSSGNGGPALWKRSKSWPSMAVSMEVDVSLKLKEEKRSKKKKQKNKKKKRVAPEGCFSVYVGAEKQRFVIKTEYANHPLFKVLLEEAESEYGFNSEGPLVLPCNVDLFIKVLLAIGDGDGDGDNMIGGQGCGFAKGYASYRLLTPPRMIAINQC